MGMVRQKLGETLSLSLQAFDGSGALFPQVILRDTAGILLATLDLMHIADGLYANRTFTMPASLIVTAQYKVYSDAPHTTLNEDYEDSIDVYIKEDAVQTPGSISIVERIEGRVSQVRLTASIVTPQLAAVIKTTRIKAQIVQSKITGQIKSNKILGILRECL